eukprot:gene9557-12870_t
MAWNPSAYLKFGSARLKPAVDLLSATVVACGNGNGTNQIRNVLDLGCGPGNLTELLCNAFPNAKIIGLDSSPEMIAAAGKNTLNPEWGLRVSYETHTVENFVEEEEKDKYDVIFSNAALHWCINHQLLLPKLIKNKLNSNGGVLAIQMPDTRQQQSHLLMETAALRTGLLNTLSNVRIPRVEQDPDWYFKLLFPFCKEINMWSTDYIQQLPVTTIGYGLQIEASHPVLEWTRSTGLKPIIDALGGESTPKCQKYLAEYERLLKEQYPILNLTNKYHSNGKLVSILPYKRFFLVCKL